MEELKFKNTIISFEHFDGKLDDIDPNKVYYSRFFLEDELKEYRIKPNSGIKLLLKKLILLMNVLLSVLEYSGDLTEIFCRLNILKIMIN